MRILMVNNSRGWGGAEELLVSLATELRNRGHFVGIFLRDGSSPAEKLSRTDFPIWTVKRNLAATLSSAVKLFRIIRKEKIDLIHVHRVHDVPVAFFAGLAAASVPILLTQHAKIGKANGLIIRMTNGIVAVSEYIAKGVIEKFPHAVDKIAIVHNGTRIHGLSQESKLNYWQKRIGVDTKGPILGTVGFFYKNQQELIELLPAIRSIFPSVQLVIIGQDDHKKWQLEEKIATLGVEQSVCFAGQIPHDEMHEALGALDLNLSAYKNEAFGLHVIEGMASGTPFIGYRAGGFPEIVEHGHSGFLVTTKEELSQTIISILQDKHSLYEMSTYARNLVERKFTVQEMVTKYEGIYREMLGNHGIQ